MDSSYHNLVGISGLSFINRISILRSDVSFVNLKIPEPSIDPGHDKPKINQKREKIMTITDEDVQKLAKEFGIEISPGEAKKVAHKVHFTPEELQKETRGACECDFTLEEAKKEIARVILQALQQIRERYSAHRKFPYVAKKHGYTVIDHGLPDFLIEKDGEFVAVEVKRGLPQSTQKSLREYYLRGEQKLACEGLMKSGLPVVVWSPGIDFSKAIEEVRRELPANRSISRS